MKNSKTPMTLAVRALRSAGIRFSHHLYEYVEHGGTKAASTSLDVDERCVIKTIVMEDEDRNAFLILMHGDRQISSKKLARFLGVKSINASDPDTARKHTGYLVGGTSPLGTKTELPVYIEASVLKLDTIYINGGKRGYLVGVSPQDLGKVLDLIPVEAALD